MMKIYTREVTKVKQVFTAVDGWIKMIYGLKQTGL